MISIKKKMFYLFLQTKIKDKEPDSEQKWITTYNDYLHRINHFYRWLYNGNGKSVEISMDLWKNFSVSGIRKTRENQNTKSIF